MFAFVNQRTSRFEFLLFSVGLKTLINSSNQNAISSKPLTCLFFVTSTKRCVYHVIYTHRHRPVSSNTHFQRRGRERNLDCCCVTEPVKNEWRQRPWDIAHSALFKMLGIQGNYVSLTSSTSTGLLPSSWSLSLFPPSTTHIHIHVHTLFNSLDNMYCLCMTLSNSRFSINSDRH